jgi:3-hydroxybutyrate dehydrogenase
MVWPGFQKRKASQRIASMKGHKMLKGKVALVTGSTSGIGWGIARQLATQGCMIVLNGLGDLHLIEKLTSDIRSLKADVRYHAADMTKPDEIADLIQTTQRECGSLDILVNNAGIQYVSPIETFPIEKWEAILAINLSASFHTIRCAFALMKNQKWGRIINIGSAHSLVASPFKSAYVAAKHGLAGLTKVVALEGAEHGVTCNAVCPGYVKTDLVENQIADTAKATGKTADQVVRDIILAAQATKKFVTIEQIATLVTFLASEEASSITGACYAIDGGWTSH